MASATRKEIVTERVVRELGVKIVLELSEDEAMFIRAVAGRTTTSNQEINAIAEELKRALMAAGVDNYQGFKGRVLHVREDK